jgi:hypothetical protein
MCFAYALLSMARPIVQPIFFLERKGDQREDLSDERLYLAEQNPDLRVQDARADTSGDDEDVAGPILFDRPPL